MSVVTCGVTLTEVLVAIGDNYWRCMSCQLRFSKLTSIDEHIRQKHEHNHDQGGLVSSSVKSLASNPKLDSSFRDISFEENTANNVSPVPAVFKVNLDNPNSSPELNQTTKGVNQSSASVSDKGQTNSSAEPVPIKCQTTGTHTNEHSSVNHVTKFRNMGHLNSSESGSVTPFGTNESPVISGLVNDSVHSESLNMHGSQLEQQNDNEDVEDLEEDGNVSKAMLASMLSLLEKGLEMDDISSVFQNVDSVSPEFFEQQLLNHSDLVDYPADSIDNSLGDYPNGVRENNKNIPVHVHSQSCSGQICELDSSSKENEIENNNLEGSSASECTNMSLVGESQNSCFIAVGKSSLDTTASMISDLEPMFFEKTRAELREDISKEHQVETSNPPYLRPGKSFKLPSKQSKNFDPESSRLKENQTDSLENISYCDANVKNGVGLFKIGKNYESLGTMESSSYEHKDPKIFLSGSMLPQLSECAGNKIAKVNQLIHCSPRKGDLSTSKSMLVSDHLKKTRSQKCLKLKQTANHFSSQHSKCANQPQAKEIVLSNTNSEIIKLSSFTESTEKPLDAEGTFSNVVLSAVANEGQETVANDIMKSKCVYENRNRTPKAVKSFLDLSDGSIISTQEKDRNKDYLINTSKLSVQLLGSTMEDIDRKSRTEPKNILKNRNSKNLKGNGNVTSFMKFVNMTDMDPTVGQARLENRSCDLLHKKRPALVSNQKGSKSKKLKRTAKHSQVDLTSKSTAKPSKPEMVRTTGMVMQNQVDSKHICIVCEASMLSVHVYKHHEGLGNPTCLVCYVKCSSPRYLLQHVRKHQKMEAEKVRKHQQVLSSTSRERIKSKYWRCGKCNAIILNKKRVIKAHVCILSKTCKQCNIEFPTVSTFKLHMASHQGRMFECSICGEFFKNKSSRDCHKLTHNSNFLCQICGRQFAHQHLLTKHAKIHSQVRKASPTLTCAECNKVYKSKRSLQRHINVAHLGMDYQYECFHCGHKFLTSNQLREHVAWQHFGEKSHQCRFCDKSFVCRPTLIRHERKEHTGDKPYKCRFCPEAFVEKRFLDTHEAKQHTLVFPYKCNECGKGFVQASYLRSHLLTHKKHKPHQCHMCGSCFSKPCHLKRHTITCLRKNSVAEKKAGEKANEDVLSHSLESSITTATVTSS
ncbi:zinc finger protein 782 [Elysia marginata]|uniref:Zinc finger protein 782 n=1 Tax=Elysia marginata TaxID=1093978 RepID=A0AAV4J4F1_9GAST|nr:zinc finger protein 782 [Elysia marginata]